MSVVQFLPFKLLRENQQEGRKVEIWSNKSIPNRLDLNLVFGYSLTTLLLPHANGMSITLKNIIGVALLLSEVFGFINIFARLFRWN